MWQVKASGFWLVAGYGFWLAAGYALKLDASGSCLRLKQVKGNSGLELMFMQDVLKCFWEHRLEAGCLYVTACGIFLLLCSSAPF